jgi:hypothetical protein
MDESSSFEQAQIQFRVSVYVPLSLWDSSDYCQDVQLSLIHIPIHLYAHYIGPILQLLLPNEERLSEIPFLNISVNPIEASVILPTSLAETFFKPLASTFSNASSGEQSGMSIAPDDYILMFVSGSGAQPSQRVIDLTTPLALAGISIFFITTYFSDYIICPAHSRSAVIAALEARGFELTNAYQDLCSSTANYAHRPATASSEGSGSLVAPGTPPPTNLSDLQIRTFAKLQKGNVIPTVDRDTELVHCAGKDGATIQDRQFFLIATMRCLLAKPKFFSLTLAEGDSPSILLESKSLPLFTPARSQRGTNGNHYLEDDYSSSPVDEEYPQVSLLNGTSSEILIPIVLDLRLLPLESTGIVCGVAGRLVSATKHQLGGPVEMSYLSSAQAGCVMVESADLDRAVEVLEQGAKA